MTDEYPYGLPITPTKFSSAEIEDMKREWQLAHDITLLVARHFVSPQLAEAPDRLVRAVVNMIAAAPTPPERDVGVTGEKLRAALERIASHSPIDSDFPHDMGGVQQYARAVLASRVRAEAMNSGGTIAIAVAGENEMPLSPPATKLSRPSQPPQVGEPDTPGEKLTFYMTGLVRLCHLDHVGSIDLHLEGVVIGGDDTGNWHLTLTKETDVLRNQNAQP